jgi:hypothetical protein
MNYYQPNELPKFINKTINFEWLLNVYRGFDLNETLNGIKKEEVSEMLQSIEFEMQQLKEKQNQNIISEQKYNQIIDELLKIKNVFIDNLSKRI